MAPRRRVRWWQLMGSLANISAAVKRVAQMAGEARRQLEEDRRCPLAVARLPHSQRTVVCAGLGDGTCRVWEMASGRTIDTVRRGAGVLGCEGHQTAPKMAAADATAALVRALTWPARPPEPLPSQRPPSPRAAATHAAAGAPGRRGGASGAQRQPRRVRGDARPAGGVEPGATARPQAVSARVGGKERLALPRLLLTGGRADGRPTVRRFRDGRRHGVLQHGLAPRGRRQGRNKAEDS